MKVLWGSKKGWVKEKKIGEGGIFIIA